MAVVYKTTLIKRIAKNTRLSQRVVGDVLNSAVKEIAASLKQGDRVQLTNFGAFYSRPRTAGKARDFKTGRVIDVPAGNVAAFRSGAVLKKAVSRATTRRRGRPRLGRLLSRLGK